MAKKYLGDNPTDQQIDNLGGELNALYHIAPRFRKLIKGTYDDDDRAEGNE